MRLLFSLTTAAVLPAVLYAQTGQALQAAADAISAEAIAHHVAVIADDSMLGRDTPSPGLEKTARYVADQFKKFGLTPAGGDRGWFQRYWIMPRLDFARSQVVFAAGGTTAVASFATAARLIEPRGPERSAFAPVVLIAGPHTATSLARVDVRHKILLYVPPPTVESADSQANTLEPLFARSAGLVVLSPLDSVAFTQRLRDAQRDPSVGASPRWAASVRPEAVVGLRDVLAAAGIDLSGLRTETTPVFRELPSLSISVTLSRDRAVDDSVRASNVIGVIAGTDPTLKDEYVVFVAHMDHIGITRGRPDSINNGADDNASGTAGLIELAKAFRRPGIRPARSIVFVATSDGARHLRGSNAFARPLELNVAFRTLLGAGVIMSGWGSSNGRFSFSLGSAARRVGTGGAQADTSKATLDTSAAVSHVDVFGARVIAAVNLDRIGRTRGDSVIVDGVSDAQFATPPSWVAAAHPELRLTVIDGGTAALPTSDQYAFVQRGVPSLSFHGTHGGMHDDSGVAQSDAPTTIDPDWAARVTRLAFYTGYDVANAPRLPQWTAAGRRAFLKSTGK